MTSEGIIQIATSNFLIAFQKVGGEEGSHGKMGWVQKFSIQTVAEFLTLYRKMRLYSAYTGP